MGKAGVLFLRGVGKRTKGLAARTQKKTSEQGKSENFLRDRRKQTSVRTRKKRAWVVNKERAWPVFPLDVS